MSRAERRLAATELSTRLQAHLEGWQGCVARLNNLDEQIDVCCRLEPQDEVIDLPSSLPLQCLMAKKVDYCNVGRILISRLQESLEEALSIQAEEVHIENRLRAKAANAGGGKSKRKKNKVASTTGVAATNDTNTDSINNDMYDLIPDDTSELTISSTVSAIDEDIGSATITSQQLCTLIVDCCTLLESVILRKECFLDLIESYPKPSDRTGDTFQQIEKVVSYDEEMLVHTLGEYVKCLSSTKSKTQGNQQDESLNDDSCNYTLDT